MKKLLSASATLAIVELLLAFLAPVRASASAFGFRAGLTKDEIVALLGPNTLTSVSGNMYKFSTAPQPRRGFEEYLCL